MDVGRALKNPSQTENVFKKAIFGRKYIARGNREAWDIIRSKYAEFKVNEKNTKLLPLTRATSVSSGSLTLKSP